jgi:hypothetical protein
MKTRRESRGRRRIRQERREKEIKIDHLQREISKERGLSRRVPPPTAEKRPENRVMEWIRECEKPAYDLMDDGPSEKASGFSPLLKMSD